MRLLNEHYDQQRYVSRRATYLGDLHQDPRIDIFQIARNDANDVFDSASQELSVQEIREREQNHEIKPLLPLPTSHNTQTIDDFKSLPPVEWTPNAAAASPFLLSRNTDHPSIEVNSRSDSIPVAWDSSPGLSQPGGQLHPATNTQQPRGIQTALESINETANQAANATMAFNGLQQTTSPAQLPDMSSSPFQDTSFSSSIAIDPQLIAASSPMSMQDTNTSIQLDSSEMQPEPNQDLLREIIDNLATERAKKVTGYDVQEPAPESARAASAMQGSPLAAEDLPTAAEVPELSEQIPNDITSEPKSPKPIFFTPNVSALANRGMRVPVKTAPGKANKRRRDSESPAQSESPEEDDDIDDADDTEQEPPAKKPLIVKLSIPSRAQGKNRQQQQPPRQIAKAAPRKAAKKKAPARKPTADNIEDVISGAVLPGNEEEAKEAAQTRVARLLDEYNADLKSRKRRQVKEGEEPDFMPEHFYTKNFVLKTDSVRCVCGTVDDDGDEMIACNGCGVWQHTDCVRVYGALPADLDTGSYSCHVCDPWAHREMVARLRSAKVLA